MLLTQQTLSVWQPVLAATIKAASLLRRVAA